VRVQCVSRTAVEKPAVGRISHEKQVIVALDVRKSAPEMRLDTALGVLFGEPTELAGEENPVTGGEVLMDAVGDVLAECVKNGVPAHVIRVANVVHL
jgi:hypothetical protein